MIEAEGESSEDSDGSYNAQSIVVLEGLEAVRRRPAMYIGSTGLDGLHHLVYEVVDNAIDEALAGHCSHIVVTLMEDGSCAVEDNGRGIPTEDHPGRGVSALEVVLTTLHAGGKFGAGGYRVSGGLHGVGVSCVNALSEWLRVDVHRGGIHSRQHYRRGRPETAVESVGSTPSRGTRVHFLPDARIFRDVLEFSADVLSWRLQELAFLNPGLSIVFSDERGAAPVSETFHYQGGTSSFVSHLNRLRSPLHVAPIHIQCATGSVADSAEIDVALQWTSLYADDTHSFVNSIRTTEGGTHVHGLRAALTSALRELAIGRGHLGEEDAQELAGVDIREGLTCVLSLRMAEPEFGGQTKSLLVNPSTSDRVESVLRDELGRHLASDPVRADAIIQKVLEASRARRASRRAGEAVRIQATPEVLTPDIYKKQFGLRSKNWHDSAKWIAHDGLLAAHGAMCEVGPEARALDVCCGSGVVGASFRGRVKEIIGLDITPEMVALARERLDDVIHGTVYDIPFPDESFELVCNREVMHLMPNPEKMMSEVMRVLKPGGQFVVGQILPFSEIDAPWMYRIFKKKQPLLYHMFQEVDFVQLLEGAGLQSLRMEEYILWEPIDVWIDTHETANLHRFEIRELFYNAPQSIRDVHPYKIMPSGKIMDAWRWCIFSGRKQGAPAPRS